MTNATEHYVLEPNHRVIDEQLSCASCGEEFEVGEKVIEVPVGHGTNWLVTIHLHCGIKEGEVEI